MKFLELNGDAIALILSPPNWAHGAQLTASLPFIDIETAISHRESRNNFGRSSRYTFEYTAHFGTVAASTEFRTGLTRLKGEQVVVPLWTDFVLCPNAFNAGATVITKTSLNPIRYGADWIIISPDSLVYEFVSVTSFTSSTLTLAAATTLNWPANTLIYPLLFGRFPDGDLPTVRAIRPEVAVAALKIIEDSPFARTLRISPATLATVGSNITELSTYRLWNVEPTYAELLDTVEVDIIYRALGFLRQDQQYQYAQFNRRGLELGFSCSTREQIRQIEHLFFDRLGPKKTFAIPTFRADLKLAYDLPIPGFDHRITIEQPSEYSDPDRPPQPGDPFLALLGTRDPSTGLTPIDPVRVDIVTGGNLTTDQPVTQTHTIRGTRVCPMLLVHLAEAKVVWDHSTPGRATTRLKFIEQPSEYFAPPPDLPEPLFLYRITEKLADPIVSRFTNYENSMTTTAAGEEVWASGPFEHGTITKSTRPGNTRTEITSWGGSFTGNPLAKLIPRTVNADLTLEILLGDANDLSAPLTTLFYGDVMGVSQRGPDLKATCVWGGRAFKRNLLKHRVRKNDNNVMFSPATHIDASSFKVPGRFASVDGQVITVGHLDPDRQAVDWFSNGWLETGAGAQKEIRSILHSDEATDMVAITIDRPLEYALVDQDVDLYPGYDGSQAQFLEKFAAGDPTNFGGYPYVPDTNPEIKAMEAVQAQGGKK